MPPATIDFSPDSFLLDVPGVSAGRAAALNIQMNSRAIIPDSIILTCTSDRSA